MGRLCVRSCLKEPFCNAKNDLRSDKLIFNRNPSNLLELLILYNFAENSELTYILFAVKARFACISWDSIAEFVKHRDLSDAHGQSPVVKSPSSTLNINAGLVMEKRAVFKEEIDNVLRWATDTGVILKIRRLDFQDIRIQRHAWFQGEDKKSNKSTRGHVGTGALNLSQLSGCLYIFLGCIVLAGMSFLAEHVVNCSIMKRNQTIFIN